MKLLTLNTHSLVEDDYESKLSAFAEVVSAERFDIIALQEVNQTCASEKAEAGGNYIKCGEIPLKKDNHILRAAELISKNGLDYKFTWLGMKKGYGKYDEGIGFLSRSAVLEAKYFTVSREDNYTDWHTRKIIGIRTAAAPEVWFYSVHTGWWEDGDPFSRQWARIKDCIGSGGRIWLMGDFNNPAEIRGEGYDLMENDGWYDSFKLAERTSGGITAEADIDGWKDRNSGGMRIDGIWSNEKTEVKTWETVFNGKSYPVVSDHYGVKITI